MQILHVLVNDGFEENSYFKCFIAENNECIIGAAIIYNRYSTWKGRTIHLEDLIVTRKLISRIYSSIYFVNGIQFQVPKEFLLKI